MKKAVELFYNSAIQGYANAQSNLGECYYNGEGVEQDHAEAFKWMKKAAEQGDADAQSVVGDMYSDGDGVQQDEEEAKKWFYLAAKQGNADAQVKYGLTLAMMTRIGTTLLSKKE